jgi:hypothetical protein
MVQVDIAIWKKPIVLVGMSAPLIVVVVVGLLASGMKTPRLDATSEGRLKLSMQELTSGMSDDQKKAFLSDCMFLALPDTMKATFQIAFLKDLPPAVNGARLFRPLQGMSAAEIRRKAEEGRGALRERERVPAPATVAQPLPGVPSPFENETPAP